MKPVRAVITGQTGVNLENVAREIAAKVAKAEGVDRELGDPITQSIVRVYSVEERIKTEIGGETLVPFLDTFNPKSRCQIWHKNCLDIINEIERDIERDKSKVPHILLTFHIEYFRRHEFFSCVDWDLLLRFAPTIFITLIDDIYDIWQRIRERETKIDTNSHFTLQNIMSWRTVVICATDTLASNLFVNPETHEISKSEMDVFSSKVRNIFSPPKDNFVFAIKHPIESLYKIIFHPEDYLIYVSFPITATRNDEDSREEVDAFVNLLRENFNIIDPLTIDEFRIDKGNKKLLPRWPLDRKMPIIMETPVKEDPLGDMTLKQIDALEESILSQMTDRDYRMIDQCDCVVVFRPTYKGKLSSGCEKEIIYAISTHKPVYVYINPDDSEEKGAFTGNVFKRTICFDSLDKLIEQLRIVTEIRRRRRIK